MGFGRWLFHVFIFFRTWKLDEIGFWWFHVSFHPIFSADNVWHMVLPPLPKILLASWGCSSPCAVLNLPLVCHRTKAWEAWKDHRSLALWNEHVGTVRQMWVCSWVLQKSDTSYLTSSQIHLSWFFLQFYNFGVYPCTQFLDNPICRWPHPRSCPPCFGHRLLWAPVSWLGHGQRETNWFRWKLQFVLGCSSFAC